MYVGTFEHSLDEKGRVVLPAAYRAHLSNGGFVSQLSGCLGVWTKEGFDEVGQRLRENVREGRANQNALRAFSANAHEVKPDSQGRIVLPARLREFAGLGREVVVTGAWQHIEIWDPDRWHEASEAANESLADAWDQGMGL